jgi:hypothetical protein
VKVQHLAIDWRLWEDWDFGRSFDVDIHDTCLDWHPPLHQFNLVHCRTWLFSSFLGQFLNLSTQVNEEDISELESDSLQFGPRGDSDERKNHTDTWAALT